VRTETQTVIESRPESITGPTAVVATTIVGNTLPPIVPLSPPPPVVPEDPEEEIDFEEEIPEPTFPEPIETPPFDLPSPEPFTPDTGGLPPLPETPEPQDPETPETPEPQDPETPTDPGRRPRPGRKNKPGKKFVNIQRIDGTGDGGRKVGRIKSLSVAVNTVRGKTYLETKSKVGAKKANRIFKNAGVKVTKSDRGRNFPSGVQTFKPTRTPKFNLPNINRPNQTRLAAQQVRDKLLTPRQVRAVPGNLITNNARTPTQPQAGRGRSNNNNNSGGRRRR
jgi:hypothetical protein